MKTLYIAICCLLFANIHPVKAQRPWKEYLIPGTMMLFAGMAEGTSEAMVWHYDKGFKKACPNANDQFWNPAISWKNKYKNNDPQQGPKFPGSMDVFVGFTDGYHMMREAKLFLDMGAMTYCINTNHNNKAKYKFLNWKTIAQDFLVLSAIRTVGFHVTYSWMFRMPNDIAH